MACLAHNGKVYSTVRAQCAVVAKKCTEDKEQRKFRYKSRTALYFRLLYTILKGCSKQNLIFLHFHTLLIMSTCRCRRLFAMFSPLSI